LKSNELDVAERTNDGSSLTLQIKAPLSPLNQTRRCENKTRLNISKQKIPSICLTRLGFAVFRVKNIFDDSLPKREPLRDGGVCSKSAMLLKKKPLSETFNSNE